MLHNQAGTVAKVAVPDLFIAVFVSDGWSVVSERKFPALSYHPPAVQARVFVDGILISAQRFWVIVAIFVLLPGCSVTTGPITLQLEDRVVRPPASVVLFLVDGLDRQSMLGLADAGRLPNIQSRFMRGGVCVEGAVASMPALTYPNLVSAITGRFPGHHGILGNQWFERSTLQIQDYLTVPTYQMAGDDFDAPTIHEILDEQFTVNIQSPARRGMDRTADNWLVTGADWLFETYTITDARVGSDVAWVGEVANEAQKWPVFSLFYFPGVDQIGHEYGSDSRTYVKAVLNADRQIGRVMDAIERARPAERSYFVLIADHGHIPLNRKRSIDLAKCLGRTLRVRHAEINDSDAAKRARDLDRYDAIVVSSGGRGAAIHLRGANGWQSAADDARIKEVLENATIPMSDASGRRSVRLVDHPAVTCVVIKSPTGSRVVTSEGEALIERDSTRGSPRYRVVEGPGLIKQTQAGTQSDAPMDFDPSQWRSSREWLAATVDSAWPDFVPQVVEMFDSSRAGDLVVFASDDWAFHLDDDGGHGSCVSRDMRIPMYFAGPGLAGGSRISCGRLVDVMPTILDLLGESGRLSSYPPIDGQSLLPELRSAGATTQSGQP